MKPMILLLVAAFFTSPLHAQDSGGTTADSGVPTPTHLYRNPRKALILGSMIPGAGHIYAGEYWRGFVNYEGTVALIGGGAMIFFLDNCTFVLFSTKSCDPGPRWPQQALGVASIGYGFWYWIASARDASHAAERANLRHNRKSAAVKAIVDAPVGPRGDWRVGVEIPW